MELKNVRRGRIREYADQYKHAIFMPTDVSWITIRFGTSRPIAPSRAPRRTKSTPKTRPISSRTACRLVAEGANMPSTLEAAKLFLEAKVLYGPAKAANAGGVATSGLEMAQNSARISWTREEVDEKLHQIMIAIHKNCFETARDLRDSRQSGERRQHRRLLEGGQCDDGSGTGVVVLNGHGFSRVVLVEAFDAGWSDPPRVFLRCGRAQLPPFMDSGYGSRARDPARSESDKLGSAGRARNGPFPIAQRAERNVITKCEFLLRQFQGTPNDLRLGRALHTSKIGSR